MTKELFEVKFENEYENEWFTISRIVFLDQTLSLQAKGMMGYICAKNRDNPICLKDVLKDFEKNIDNLESILKECCDKGYLYIEGNRFQISSIGSLKKKVNDNDNMEYPY